MEKEPNQTLKVAAIISIGTLLVVVVVLLGTLVLVTNVTNNLSALLENKLALNIPYYQGGTTRTIETQDGEFQLQDTSGGQTRTIQQSDDTFQYQGTTETTNGLIEIQRGGTGTELEYGVPGTTRTINVEGGQLKIEDTAGGVSRIIEVESATAGPTRELNILTDGGSAILQIKGGVESLKLDVISTGLSGEAKEVIVSLGGNSVLLINDNEDLEVYGQLVIEAKPVVRNITITTSGVNVEYRQEAKFLGIVPLRIKARATVDNQNRVRVRLLPWYSFLFRADTDEVKTEIELGIREEETSRSRVYITSGANQTTIQARTNAKKVDIISSGVETAVRAEAGTATPSPTATPTGACQLPAEFPFGNYPVIIELQPASVHGTVIAGGVDAKDGSQTTLMITKDLHLKANARITNAYVFTATELEAGSSITNLYVQTGTIVEQHGTVGNMVRLSKSDLIRKALVAAGLRGQECNY